MNITVKTYKKDVILGDYIGFYIYLEDENGNEQSVSVHCSGTLKAVWNIKDDVTLFYSLYPLIRKELIDLFDKGVFKNINEIVPLDFSTYNSPKNPPTAKYSLPDVIKVKVSSSKDLPSSVRVVRPKQKISILGYDIAKYRDNINSIIKKKYGFRLFEIEQERAIVDMYMPCNSEDEYNRRIAALRNLFAWINKDGINKKIKPSISKNMERYFILKNS
jgi:hypothetical protein